MHLHQIPQRGTNISNQQLHANQSQPVQQSQSQVMHHISNQQQQVEAIMKVTALSEMKQLNGPKTTIVKLLFILLQSKKARFFLAMFDYDPTTMSPNPDGCEEELPFQEGDTIKVVKAILHHVCL